MTEVILIFPETGYQDRNMTGCMLPLAVLQIAAPLLREEISVKIIDQRVPGNWKEILRSELKKGKTICVGISSMTGPQITGGIEAAKLVRYLSPDIPIVWGGVHPSLMPDQTIQNEFVDIVVIGDGELTFQELVRKIHENKSLESIEGIYYKNGVIYHNSKRSLPDINQLPWPAYDLVNVSNYMESAFSRGRGLAMVTSRGCPNRCAYCYNQAYFSRRWRGRSPESVVEHMKFLQKSFNVNLIFIFDDNFFVNYKRVTKICEYLLKEKLNLTIENANITVQEILKYDLDLLKLLRNVGFKQLFIGIEAGSNELLTKIQKDITVEMIHEANLKLKKAGIIGIFSWMTGFPFETRHHTEETLTLMRSILKENPLAIVYGLNIFTPYPGTPLYDICIEQGMKEPKKLEDWKDRDFLELFIKENNKKDNVFLIKAQMMARYLDPKVRHKQGGTKGLLLRIYSYIINFRVKYGFYRLMPEIILLRRKIKRSRMHYMK